MVQNQYGDADVHVDERGIEHAAVDVDRCLDAIVLLKVGQLVHEQYLNGQTAADRHVLMSVNKSFTGPIATASHCQRGRRFNSIRQSQNPFRDDVELHFRASSCNEEAFA